jgi:hypothetical protein
MNLPKNPWFGLRMIETRVAMKMMRPMRPAIDPVTGSMRPF